MDSESVRGTEVSRASPVSALLTGARAVADLSVSQGLNDPKRSRRCGRTQTEAVRGRVVRQRGVALKTALQRRNAVPVPQGVGPAAAAAAMRVPRRFLRVRRDTRVVRGDP